MDGDSEMMPEGWIREDYLESSELCDFESCPSIRAKTEELTGHCGSDKEKFQWLFDFVKEIPYGLEDWDVPASETLAKGWGMCSGKANLLVAMLRSVGIPARYRVYKIRAEVGLWKTMARDRLLAEGLGEAPEEQDHVDCEVWLGEWVACDPARDTGMERGMMALGIPLERKLVAGARGAAPYVVLPSLDRWARRRQERRRFREDREGMFSRVNRQLDELRKLGGERGGSR